MKHINEISLPYVTATKYLTLKSFIANYISPIDICAAIMR